MNKHEFHKIWIEQCEATEGIRDRYGKEDAIRYLIGEKFLNVLQESDRRPEFATEVPNFVAGVKEIFEPHEISEFLDALLHERSAEQDKDWPFDDFEDAELEPRDVVNEAESIFLIERAKELLLS
ncbi:MAG: hypothetical protein HY717_04255 [Planctomycetes bacterium]|nr:hypothetical protein [Planctomycetota bacterium]